MNMRAIRTVVCLAAMGGLLSSLWPTNAAAADWVVVKSQMAGACNVQEATSRPLLGTVLGKFSTRKAACEFAKKMGTSECQAYTNGAIGLCQAEKISLK